MTKSYKNQGAEPNNWTSFKNLFDQYYAWLCTYVYKISKDESLSKDIVQEVFITVWEKRHSITINTSLKGYLLRSCHNGYLKHLRSIKIKCTPLDMIKLETICESYEEENEIYELKMKAITNAIEELPPKCKEIFLLHKFEKIKYKEIAESMGISIKTVENHISKALSHLRNSVLHP